MSLEPPLDGESHEGGLGSDQLVELLVVVVLLAVLDEHPQGLEGEAVLFHEVLLLLVEHQLVQGHLGDVQGDLVA